MTDYEVKHYVKFLYPGIFVSESESREIESRGDILIIPASAFAFYFYDRVIATVEVDGESVKCTSGCIRPSKNYYPDGQIYTRAQVAKEHGEDSILYNSLRANGYELAVKTRLGNWQWFDPDKDEIVPLAWVDGRPQWVGGVAKVERVPPPESDWEGYDA